MKSIVLAGNATTAEILYRYIGADPRYELAGLTVDDAYVEQGSRFDHPTVGLSRLTQAFPPGKHAVVMAMGYDDVNETRRSMFERLKALGYEIATYVHPHAMIHSEHPLGEGSLVLPGAVVEPHVRVGADSMIWSNVTLAHHSTVGDHCWVASGAVVSGKATIGDNCFIGVNATIVNAITLGRHVVVGGGALLTRDAKDGTVHLARSAEQIRYASRDYAKHIGV